MIRVPACAALFLVLPTIDIRGAEFEYEPGYDPQTARPDSVLVVPQSAWGDEMDGLQAAISGPGELRFNERARFHIVVRNVSGAPVKVTLKSEAIHPYLTPEGKPTAVGGYSNDNRYTRFEIAPGHHVAIPFPEIVVVRGDGVAPTHAKRDLKPGKHFLTASIGAGGDRWGFFKPGEPGGDIEYPADEWQGNLETKPHAIELLDEDIPLEIPPPAGLEDIPDLEPALVHPEGVDFSETSFELRPGLQLHADAREDVHWLKEFNSYDRHLFWGPFPSRMLEDRSLLDPIAERIREGIQGENGHKNNQAQWELRRLATLQRPFVEMVYELIPSIVDPDIEMVNNGYDFLMRAIRDRRVELREMGMEEETKEALDALSRFLPPLPPESDFRTVTADEGPDDAPEAGDVRWGPVNDGLRAAAVMPETIRAGETAEVKLFIRNVSAEPVFLTVADKPGYDTASAVDANGEPVEVKNQLVYPMVIISVLRPEIDPGLSAIHPPVADLVFLELEPGAVWKVTPHSELHYSGPDDSRPPSGESPTFGPRETPAISRISGAPGEVSVTWELHTANGAKYAPGLKSRIWPARGGWSGLLHTAPAKVKLVEAE